MCGNLQMAQITPILTLLLTLTWAFERTGRSSQAALLLGVAIAIKLFPAYLVVYYIARKQLQPLLTSALSFLLLTLATILLLGFDAYRDYLLVVLPRLGMFQGWGYNYSIAGFWHKLFDPAAELTLVPPLCPSLALARSATLLTNFAVTAMVIRVACRARSLIERDLAFASTITATLLVSPLTWDISLLLLLIPIAVIAHATTKSQSSWMRASFALILPIIWLPQPLLMKLFSPFHRTTSVACILGPLSLKFYALLAIFALGLAGSWPQPERQHESLR
jgi:hypothetical protein